MFSLSVFRSKLKTDTKSVTEITLFFFKDYKGIDFYHRSVN